VLRPRGGETRPEDTQGGGEDDGKAGWEDFRRFVRRAARAAGRSAQAGIQSAYQNGAIYEFSTPESLLEIDFELPVFVLVDRIAVTAENRARIVDAAEIGYRESGEILFEMCRATRKRRLRGNGSVFPRLRVQELPSGLSRAGAEPVLV